MKWLLFAAAFAGAFLLEFPVLLAAESSSRSPALAKQNTCMPEAVASCKSLANGPVNLAGDKATGFSDVKPERGTVLNSLPVLNSVGKKTNIALSNRLLQAGVPTSTQIAKSIELGKKMRDRAIAQILGLPYSPDVIKEQTRPQKLKTYAPEKRISIERLLALGFFVPERKHPACDMFFAEGIPNAMYEAETNSIAICPSLASETESAIALSLSHEIGHAVSPYSTSLLQYKIKGNSDADVWALANQCGAGYVYHEEQDYNDEEAVLLNKTLSSSSRSILANADTSALRNLENCGLIEYVEDSKTMTGDVFQSNRNCIETKTRSLYEAANPVRTNTAAHTEVARLNFMRAAEEFADNFGAKLYDSVVPEMKWSASEIRAALLPYRVSACEEEQNEAAYSAASYPRGDDRVRQHLNQPNAAKSLGCAPPQVACPFKLDETKPVTPSSQGKSSPTSKAQKNATGGAAR